jgi:hypothetical protein
MCAIKGLPCHGSWTLVSPHPQPSPFPSSCDAWLPGFEHDQRTPAKGKILLPLCCTPRALLPHSAKHSTAQHRKCSTPAPPRSQVSTSDGGARHAHRIDQIGAGLPIIAGHVECPPEPLSGPGHGRSKPPLAFAGDTDHSLQSETGRGLHVRLAIGHAFEMAGSPDSAVIHLGPSAFALAWCHPLSPRFLAALHSDLTKAFVPT